MALSNAGNAAPNGEKEGSSFTTILKRTRKPGNSPEKKKKKGRSRQVTLLATTRTRGNASLETSQLIPGITPPAVEPELSQPQPSTSAFFTANPFTPLAVADMEEPSPAPQREHKPPPIILKNVRNFLELCNELTQLNGPNSFTCVSRVNDVKICTLSIDAYRATVRFLRENGKDFHTYQPKDEKSYRVVIRNLHNSTPTDAIKQELESQGFKVRSVTNVRHPVDKTTLLPLFFVDLEPSKNNPDIYKISTLLYSKVKFEEPHKTIEIAQCKRCQEYGHTRSYCNHEARCVKCAGKHATAVCNKKRDEPAKCVLCQGEHPANYRGCVIHKELQRVRRTSSRERSGYRPPTAPKQQPPSFTQAAFPSLATSRPAEPPRNQYRPSATRRQTSYADVTRPTPAPQPTYIPPPPSSSDITSLLNSFINEFKSLLTPLITLLTTVVGELLPRLSR